MSSNEFYSGRQANCRAALRCAGLSALLALAACSGRPAERTAPVQTAEAPDQGVAESPQTVTEVAAAAGDQPDDAGTTTVISDAGTALKAGAPKNYVVQRGDTLWGIANMFLRNPYQWPEIWYVNPEIRNPHRIYPGDTVRLALRGDGKVALQVVHSPTGPATRLEPLLRSTALEGPIATIPYTAIAAFLSRPGVLTGQEINAAPYILALRDDHQIAGEGHDLYVKKLSADTGARYSVMHVDEMLRDPDSGAKLGYLAIYTGTAQVTRPGSVAKVVLTDSARETLRGDVLVPEDNTPTSDFVPHAPAQSVSGRVIAVVDNVLLAGQYEVIAINRGTHDGLERGNVLTVDQDGADVADHCAAADGRFGCSGFHHDKLPNESTAALLVFKTYEHMSYALVVSDTVPIQVNDHVRNP